MAQQMPLPLTISCSSKSRLVLPSDDLVVIVETEDDLINEWKDNMQNRGTRLNMNKTKVM